MRNIRRRRKIYAFHARVMNGVYKRKHLNRARALAKYLSWETPKSLSQRASTLASARHGDVFFSAFSARMRNVNLHHVLALRPPRKRSHVFSVQWDSITIRCSFCCVHIERRKLSCPLSTTNSACCILSCIRLRHQSPGCSGLLQTFANSKAIGRSSDR